MLKDKIKSALEKSYEAETVNELMKTFEAEGVIKMAEELEADKETKAFSQDEVDVMVKSAVEKLMESNEESPVIKMLKGQGSQHKEELGLEKGLAYARIAKMKVQHALWGEGKSLDAFINDKVDKHYSRDTGFCKMAKSAVMKDINSGKVDRAMKAINNSTFGEDGGYLVPEMYGEIVELLRPMVFLFQAGARTIPMPYGSLNMPVHNVGALSYFMGETKKAKGKKQGFKNIKMVSKKQVSMAIMSNELLRVNTYDADMAFLNDILREMAQKMNEVALTGAGTEYVPRGIENTTGVQTAALGALPDGDTPYTLAGLVEKTNVPMDSAKFVMPRVMKSVLSNAKDANGNYVLRDDLRDGVLAGYPFIYSNVISTGTTGNNVTKMYFGDWSQFLVGTQSMFEVEYAKEATVLDENDEAVYLFGQDCTAVRVISHYDFAIKYGEAFAYYSNVYTKA